jgi:2-oxoglutarate ferredoxin oxidoreductase subunit gamma
MTEKSFIAGFGGQGVVSLGRLWVECAMAEGLEVSFFPFYGAEKRGGISRASVIVSSEEIASPLVTKANSAVVMDENSLSVCEETLEPGGLLILNSSLVRSEPKRGDIRVRRIPATKIAEGLGDGRAANAVMLGALAGFTGAIRLSAVNEALEANFGEAKRKLIDLNAAAIKAGMAEAKSAS